MCKSVANTVVFLSPWLANFGREWMQQLLTLSSTLVIFLYCFLCVAFQLLISVFRDVPETPRALCCCGCFRVRGAQPLSENLPEQFSLVILAQTKAPKDGTWIIPAWWWFILQVTLYFSEFLCCWKAAWCLFLVLKWNWFVKISFRKCFSQF